MLSPDTSPVPLAGHRQVCPSPSMTSPSPMPSPSLIAFSSPVLSSFPSCLLVSDVAALPLISFLSSSPALIMPSRSEILPWRFLSHDSKESFYPSKKFLDFLDMFFILDLFLSFIRRE
ncbi:hypothetical protein J5N97_001827 [Dioscorea zingiberensis]|uniref:Uncharacterized protein n=1 Tax=Dioscorea zingiberensis TaxID=325984 RepID=A0A9D5BTC7_9LILI|nr:hypothetical protein J5N97_001827 [Dioscorea zingiberensis]